MPNTSATAPCAHAALASRARAAAATATQRGMSMQLMTSCESQAHPTGTTQPAVRAECEARVRVHSGVGDKCAPAQPDMMSEECVADLQQCVPSSHDLMGDKDECMHAGDLRQPQSKALVDVYTRGGGGRVGGGGEGRVGGCPAVLPSPPLSRVLPASLPAAGGDVSKTAPAMVSSGKPKQRRRKIVRNPHTSAEAGRNTVGTKAYTLSSLLRMADEKYRTVLSLEQE